MQQGRSRARSTGFSARLDGKLRVLHLFAVPFTPRSDGRRGQKRNSASPTMSTSKSSTSSTSPTQNQKQYCRHGAGTSPAKTSPETCRQVRLPARIEQTRPFHVARGLKNLNLDPSKPGLSLRAWEAGPGRGGGGWRCGRPAPAIACRSTWVSRRLVHLCAGGGEGGRGNPGNLSESSKVGFSRRHRHGGEMHP